MKIAFTFKDTVPNDEVTVKRCVEIYHRLIGQFYHREVDSQFGVTETLLRYRHEPWEIEATMEILASIVNNPSIHDMLRIDCRG